MFLYSENLFILGDAFMSKHYCVFNRDNNTVGIAKAYHSCIKEDTWDWD